MAREYSENTQTYVDEEVARIIEERYARVLKTLKEKKDTLEKITRRLLDTEVIEAQEFFNLAGIQG